MHNLAIFGGSPVRTKPFMSRPHVDDRERQIVDECLRQGLFSRFIGSPVGDFRKYLGMESSLAEKLEDFWSVLGGKFVRLFEAEFARAFDVKFAVSMNSCTSCLTAALLACGVGSGDEVVTTPFSFTATATALHLAGARVRFADIDPETFCVTRKTVEGVLSKKTRAVIPVHILGNAGHVHELEELCLERDLVLVEDSAQALLGTSGKRFLGTFGSVGVFSFQETKNMMTGEGGMAITNDRDLAYKLRLIRNHGEAMVFEDDPPHVVEAAQGYNFRLPEPLAAIGYVQTLKLEFLNNIRRKNWEYLRSKCVGFDFIRFQRITNDEDGFYPYCVGAVYRPDILGVARNLIAEALRCEGIPVSTGFPRLLNENLLFSWTTDETPVAKRLNEEEYIGFFQIGYPNTTGDMDDIANALEKIHDCQDELRVNKDKIGASREYSSGRL